jgi:hypothetical protein
LVPAPEHSESKYDSGRQQLPAAFVLPGVGGAGGSEVCIFGLVETSHRPSVALLQRCKMAALTASGRHELTTSIAIGAAKRNSVQLMLIFT